MSPSGNTSLGRKREPRSDSEFAIFNLVIRLSKVEQLAFSIFSPIGRVTVEQLAAVLGLTFLFDAEAVLIAVKPSFFQLCPREYGA